MRIIRGIYHLKLVLFHSGAVQEVSRDGEGGEHTPRGAGAPTSHQPQERGAVPRLSHHVVEQTCAQPTQESLWQGRQHHRQRGLVCGEGECPDIRRSVARIPPPPIERGGGVKGGWVSMGGWVSKEGLDVGGGAVNRLALNATRRSAIRRTSPTIVRLSV